jgi:hypothetical protein
MKLLNTSEAECTASLIIAPEWATMPARSLIIERAVFPATLTSDTRVAVFSKISSCPKEDTSLIH